MKPIKNDYLMRNLASTFKKSGDIYTLKGVPDKAECYYRCAVDIYEELAENGLIPIYEELIETYESTVKFYEERKRKDMADIFRKRKEEAKAIFIKERSQPGLTARQKLSQYYKNKKENKHERRI